MACFSPRLQQRPIYDSGGKILYGTLIRWLRFSLLCAIFTRVTTPLYFHAYTYFNKMRETWTEVSYTFYWVNGDDIFFTIGLSLCITTVYFITNGFFAICDEWQCLQRYKLPRRPSQEPSKELVIHTLKSEAIAHFVTAPPLMCLVVGPLFQARSSTSAGNPENIPGLYTIWLQFFLSDVLYEFMFYWGHRILHSQHFYGIIHKKHHLYINTRSFAAEYSHPLEAVLANYIPVLAGLFITGVHFHVAFMWFFCRIVKFNETHSGYCFKGTWLYSYGLTFADQAAFHDHHHTVNRGNFGSPLTDWLFGTMDSWIEGGRVDGYIKKKVK